MNTALVWSNLLAYSLQVGLLVALAAFVPALLRMRAAGARLIYWQLLLAACLLLPWVRPWHREVIAANVSVTTLLTSVAAAPPAHFHLAAGNALLYLLAAGVVARLAWLAAGLWRLRRYRRRAVRLDNSGVWAEVLLSSEVSSPVTFGWRHPVILLPERFPQLSRAMQQAILCHEDLHVERNDWLFTVAEELVRAVLWFHPAIWWLLAEIQLAREQAVDARVVQITESRDHYVDALLDMAGARPELDLAPAPLFLRKRHLKQRVIEIVREATMSKARRIFALAAGVVFLAAGCWMVTGAFPLAAAPQMVSDSPGVAVDLGGAPLMHRSAVDYPSAALAKGIQGTAVVEVRLDASGMVAGAGIVSGPEELARALLQSAVNWHFDRSAGGTTRQVIATFELPQERAMATGVSAGATGGIGSGVSGGVAGGVGGGVAGGVASGVGRSGGGGGDSHIVLDRVADLLSGPIPPNTVLKSIVISRLSDQARADLLARLPYHEGDTLPPGKISDVMHIFGQAAAEFDEHLRVQLHLAGNAAEIEIAPVGSVPHVTTDGPVGSVAAEGSAAIPQKIKVGDAVQAANLITPVPPVYPPEAKQARVQGIVELQATIGTDGHVIDLKVVRGHPLLVQAALDAVKQWVYRPTLLNGQPVEVVTTIQVNFTLQ